MKVRKMLLAVVIAILASPCLHAATQSISSQDGTKTLTLDDGSDSATYTSGNGTLLAGIPPEGLQMGNVTLSVSPTSVLGASTATYDITVTQGNQQITGSVQVTSDGQLVGGAGWDDVAAALQVIASSGEGQLLQEAHVTFPVDPPGTLGVGDQLYGLGECTGNLLNGVAGAAALIGGCGTPSCGPAYRWCCGSGITWYASALVAIWNTCRVAAWQ